jgi:hypothetical protein
MPQIVVFIVAAFALLICVVVSSILHAIAARVFASWCLTCDSQAVGALSHLLVLHFFLIYHVLLLFRFCIQRVMSSQRLSTYDWIMLRDSDSEFSLCSLRRRHQNEMEREMSAVYTTPPILTLPNVRVFFCACCMFRRCHESDHCCVTIFEAN